MSFELVSIHRTKQQNEALKKIRQIYARNHMAVIDQSPDGIEIKRLRKSIEDVWILFSLPRWTAMVELADELSDSVDDENSMLNLELKKDMPRDQFESVRKQAKKFQKEIRNKDKKRMWLRNDCHQVCRDTSMGFLMALGESKFQAERTDKFLNKFNEVHIPQIDAVMTRELGIVGGKVPRVTVEELEYDIPRFLFYRMKNPEFQIC